MIIGLPESPVKDITPEERRHPGEEGAKQVAYADVTASDLKVTATEGENITVAPNAKLTVK